MEPEFKIEKGIKIPHPGHRKMKLPFDINAMKIWDSVFIPIAFINDKYNSKSHAQTYISSYARQSGKKVITRTVENGIRIWRTK